MRILVTGASGFLGREVVARLASDHDVVGLAHAQEGNGWRRCDIRNDDAVRRLLEDVRPDSVVHLAAYRDPDFCEEHPDECMRLNLESTRSLCSHLPASASLHYISTDYAFDGQHPPYHESDVPHPVNRYGRSKVASEQIVLARADTTVLRVPLLIGGGPTLAQSGIIGQMVTALRDPTPRDVDDVLVRFPTWIRDVADGIAFLIGQQTAGVYHLSGPRGATRYAWTRDVARILGADSRHLTPSSTILPRAALRPPNSQLADPRIHDAGFRPCTVFSDAVRDVLDRVGRDLHP